MVQTGAREFFESVREASRDAESCRRQLEVLERAAYRLPGPSMEPHISGGSRDGMERHVVNMVDREAELHARIEDDYRLIDAACAVLYGADGTRDGLASLAPPWWADVLYYRFVQGRTWAEVGALLGYSPEYCCRVPATAFDLLDANGMAATIAGIGMAEATA